MSNQKPKYKGVKATTPVGRVSFPALMQPKLKYQSETEYEYSVELLFSKSEDLKSFQAKCDEALAEVYGKEKAKWPKNISYPLTNQDNLIEKAEIKGQSTDHLESGAFYARFKTSAKNSKPVVVDEGRNEIIDATQIYGGCYGRVSCHIKVNPIKGKDPVTKKESLVVYVTPYLQGFQKLKDGPTFGGSRPSVDDMFEPVTFADDEVNPLL